VRRPPSEGDLDGVIGSMEIAQDDQIIQRATPVLESFEFSAP
jgi:hypothetical protein